MKGRFVSDQTHRENDKHSRDEVSAAVKRFKARLPKDRVTMSDTAFIVDLCGQADHNPDEDD